jgi:thymidylate synthase
MRTLDEWFSHICGYVHTCGYRRHDKTSLAGHVLRLDLSDSVVPALQLKTCPHRLAIAEMRFFCSGSSDLSVLEAAGVNWWKPWTAGREHLVSETTLPYLRLANETARIKAMLADDPYKHATRMVASIWPEYDEVWHAWLPPCAYGHQVLVDDEGLHLHVHQRSADLLLGVPSNVIQYGWLGQQYAQVAQLPLVSLVFHYGDLHIYNSHLETDEFKQLCNADRLQEAMSLPEPTWSDDFQTVCSYESVKPNLRFELVPVHAPAYSL